MQLSGNHVDREYFRKTTAEDCIILSIPPCYGEGYSLISRSRVLEVFSFPWSGGVSWFGLSQIVSSPFWLVTSVLIVLCAVPPKILRTCRTKGEGSYCGHGLQDMQEQM